MPGGYEGACAPGQECPLSAVPARALGAGVLALAELAAADGVAAPADNADAPADNAGVVAAAEVVASGVAELAAEAVC
jgi:hypothetical protein